MQPSRLELLKANCSIKILLNSQRGSAKANGREPNSCFGWVFNLKLGCFWKPHGRQTRRPWISFKKRLLTFWLLIKRHFISEDLLSRMNQILLLKGFLQIHLQLQLLTKHTNNDNQELYLKCWAKVAWSGKGIIKVYFYFITFLRKLKLLFESCFWEKFEVTKYRNCSLLKCQWAKCLLAKCLLAKCLLAKCLLAKCLLAKCFWSKDVFVSQNSLSDERTIAQHPSIF